ncbi:MAG: hypothetical protein QOG80_2670 [Pseudonocardiales bacterium]|jgi:hypothetical protein|nr:hypothetical protein [Pseudonocardiales bacterium]
MARHGRVGRPQALVGDGIPNDFCIVACELSDCERNVSGTTESFGSQT